MGCVATVSPSAFFKCKTHRYVAIIEGLNRSFEQGIIGSDAKPILNDK